VAGQNFRGLSVNSERTLRYASRAAAAARARLSVIHSVPAGDSSLPIQLDLGERAESAEKQEARRRLDALKKTVGCDALIRITVGPVKEALLEEGRRSDADVLVIGRSPQPGARGCMRHLTYALVRDSPYPVASV
jgi:nucleotide-binding universal stress UspA family protein